MEKTNTYDDAASVDKVNESIEVEVQQDTPDIKNTRHGESKYDDPASVDEVNRSIKVQQDMTLIKNNSRGEKNDETNSKPVLSSK
jgi:hypothetical protein